MTTIQIKRNMYRGRIIFLRQGFVTCIYLAMVGHLFFVENIELRVDVFIVQNILDLL